MESIHTGNVVVNELAVLVESTQVQENNAGARLIVAGTSTTKRGDS